MSGESLPASFCTNWDAFNTPRLWAMVKDEDESAGHEQVIAWRALGNSVRDQRRKLVEVRANLIESWPPESSSSAQAFVRELDALILQLSEADTGAHNNATALAGIVEALHTAKTNIKPLWEKYKEKSDDFAPRWWDSAEDELDSKARDHMFAAERAVQEAAPKLAVPAPYVMEADSARSSADRRKAASGGAASLGAASGGAGGGNLANHRIAGGSMEAVPHTPVPAMPGMDAVLPDGQEGSPQGASGGGSVGLASVITPTQSNQPAPGVLPGSGGGVPTMSAGGSGLLQPGVLPALGGSLGAGRSSVSRGAAGTGAGAGFGSRVTSHGGGLGSRSAGANGGMGMPPAGGMAGGRGLGAGRRASTPPPRPSWLPDDAVGPNRNMQGGGPGMMGGPQGANRRSNESGTDRDFDPDNPWQVAEGVDPVIRPASGNFLHDPGPNVIGWRA